MYNTALSRDGPVPSQEAGQQLGQDGGAVADLQRGEIAEEKVHGSVQVPVCHHQHNNEDVPSHRYQVDHKQEDEEWCLERGHIPHSQQDKLH